MLSSTEAAWMVSYEVMGGPLADASVWRGALLWAIALYVPLSAPLSTCLLYTSPSPRDATLSRMPSSA